MSHAYAARGARQTAIIAAIVGLHFAAFLVIVTGLRLPPVVEPEPPVVRLLPKPKPTEPVIYAPDAGPIVDVFPEAYPKPDIPIPQFEPDDSSRVAEAESTAGVTGGSSPYVEDFVPPALRTRPAHAAAAINACYPAAARRMNEEGTVIALVTIGADGSPVNWGVAHSSGFARLDAAIACVLRRLEFVAGRRDGQAVSAEARLPIVFQLD
jgi:protein TonB